MWPRTDLIKLLGITHPIIQAPMAGSTTPELVAAVSNAGGLGSLGCARLSPDAVREKFNATRQATNKPFNFNFFIHEDPALDVAAAQPMRDRLAAYFREFGLGDVPEAGIPIPTFDEAMLETLLEIRPGVASFHFGIPEKDAVRALRDAGVIVIGSATTVAEARILADHGVDAVIAQGHEAGGHRGTFAGPLDGGTVGTLPLVPQIADVVQVPVIAAGGIGDGRGIAAAFALGASGVQLGTAFLTCPEASVHPAWQDALLNGRDHSTQVTRLFSGRPARAIRNRYMEEMADFEDQAAAFPIQYGLTTPLRETSAAQGSGDFQSMWAGQAMALNRALPAAELVERLAEEAQAAMKGLSGG